MVMKKKNNNIPSVLQRYRNNMKYFKQLKDLLEAHETNKKSKALYDELYQKQKTINYRLELDRIRGELENNRLPLRTKQQLEDRKEKLLKAIKYNLDDLDKIK
jgi:hypothetical protein